MYKQGILAVYMRIPNESIKYVNIFITIVIKMLTYMRSGYENILKLFYNNPKEKIHLREIARQTELHEPSVYRILNELEHDNILQSEKEGNLKKYSLTKTKQTYHLLTAFDIERFASVPTLRKRAIHTFLKTLPEQPVFAILFGSTAKETHTKDSDIDILLVTNKKIQTRQAKNKTDALTATQVNTVQITYDEFLKELKLQEDSVIQSAIHTGYPLTNHIQYYEVAYERI